MKKRQIVALGLWVDTSGLSRVIHNVFKKVAQHFDVTLIGLGYLGQPCNIDGISVLPCNVNGGDMYGIDQADEEIKARNADCLFICCDLGLLQCYAWLIRQYEDKIPTVLYLPMDGYILDPLRPDAFPPFTNMVLYTQFGVDEINRSYDAIGQIYDVKKPQISVIPHGVDFTRFRPLALTQRQRAFEQLLGPQDFDYESSFIVLNANRPHYRKRIDLTIAGFALFAQDKPASVKLYLHNARTIPEERQEILDWIKQYKIEDRVILNEMKPREDFLGDDELNLLYNICKVGINTSMGEGWGLVSFEHAATGAAQIVPDHTSCSELWRNSAHMLPAVTPCDLAVMNVSMREVEVQDIADALNKLYNDRNYLEELSEKGRVMVTTNKYDWDNIQDEWVALFENVFSEIEVSK